MKNYPVNMCKYLNEIFDCLNLMIIKIKNKDIQCQSYSLFPNLIKTAKLNSQFDYKQLSKQAFGSLWEKFIEENDSTYK